MLITTRQALLLVMLLVTPLSANESVNILRVTPVKQKSTLSVVFKNLQVEKGGVLKVVLVNSEDSFAKKAEDNVPLYRVALYNVKQDSATVQFHNIDYGTYAIQAFQDSNDNNTVDIGFFGPTERYGFSNNAMGFLSPPSYDAAKFLVAEKDMRMEIKLR